MLDDLPGALARLHASDLVNAPASLAWRMARLEPDSRFQRTPHTRLEVGEPRANGLRPLRFMAGHTPNLTRSIGEVEVSDKTVTLLRWLEGQTRGPFACRRPWRRFPISRSRP